MYSEGPPNTLSPSLQLHEAMRELLRGAARRSPLRDVTSDLDERTRRALDKVCRIARLETLRAEELLVLLKDCWRRLPESHRVDRSAADAMLGRVITHCITEFYR